ncbi:hypothetical protein Anae109_2236 [Anaeromyxobacter sp. Fw109-5]|nr:hypothetical protein Anae109_2236 [Anaeromyxobacter sp. Fw109-5]
MHHREQPVRVDRLRHVVGGARRERLLPVALHRLGGEGDDGQVPVRLHLPDLLDGGEPVHLRHHRVHEDEVHRRVLPQEPDRVPPVLRVEHAHPLRLEHAVDREHVADVVVREEHGPAREVGVAGEGTDRLVVLDAGGRPRRGVRAAVPQGQQQREGAPLAGLALDLDRPAQQPRDLAADGQPQAGPAVLAARGAVGLLERLEDEPLLVRRDADARVRHRERDRVALGARPRPPRDHRHRDGAPGGELHRVGEQVLEDLLQAGDVGEDGPRQLGVERDREGERLLLGDVAEVLLEVLAHRLERRLARVDLHLPRLHLGEVEDLVDEPEQLVARGVHRARELDLLRGQVPLPVLGEHLRQDEQAVERRAELVRHVREELRLVLGDELELLRLLLQAAARELDLAVLLLEQLGLLVQLARLRLELGVGPLQLLQELLGPHARADHVEDDADVLHELIEEGQVVRAELLERGELDHRLRLALEQHRQDHHGARRRLPHPGRDVDEVRRHMREQDALLLERALPDERLLQAVRGREGLPAAEAVARDEVQGRSAALVVAVHQEEGAVRGVHERRELRDDRLGHGDDVPLPLHHVGEVREVRLEPVLLGVLLRRLLQGGDHLVDVVLQGGHLALRLDRDGAGEIALRHRRRDLRDGAHLRGEVPGELVHVVREVAPGARGAGHLRLTAELPLDADLSRDPGHLVREDAEGVGHRVDGLGEGGHLALRLEHELLRQVAVRHRRHDLHDAAHLRGQVRGHEVHVVGEVLPRAGDARHPRLRAQLALHADLARHRRHLIREGAEGVGHRVDGLGEGGHLALRLEHELLRQVAVRDGGDDLHDAPHLGGEVRGHEVHVVGEVLPRAADAAHVRLTAQLPLRADLARDARHLRGERVQLVDHLVDDVLDLEDLPLHVDRDLLGEVSVGDRGRHLGHVPQLDGQVGGHRVHVVGEVLPRAADAAHLGLAAELALRADLLRDAGHLRGERVQLVHHHVDGVLQLEDLALRLDGDLLGQIALRDGGRHLGDVAHLGGQVRGEAVHVVGEVLPGAADAAHLGLAAELPLRADLLRDAGHLRGERTELIDHGVDGGLQLEDLPARVDGDLLREVAVRDRGRHLGDVPHLRGEVRREAVHVVGEVLPGAADTAHLGLAAELALRADLLRDAGDLRGERVQLVDHLVDDVLDLEDLPLHVDRDLLAEIPVRDGGRHLGHVAQLDGQVGRHRVHVVGEVLPGAADAAHLRLAPELALRADLARDARHLRGERVQLVDHLVDDVLDLEDLPLHVDGDLLRQIAVGDRDRDLRHVAQLDGQVRRHRVHVVGEVLPGAGDALHVGLAAELALRADLLGDARHLRREGAQRVDHRVDGVLQLVDLAPRVDGDLLREVAVRDRGRDLGDVAHLRGEVRREAVHVVGEVLPGAGDALHVGLAAELALRADLLGDARHLRREGAQRVDHRVDGVLQLVDLAPRVDGDLLREVAVRDRGRDLGDVPHLRRQVRGEAVHVVGEVLPGAADALHVGLAAQLPLVAHLLRDARHLRREGLELIDHHVDGVLELEDLAPRVDGDLLREVALGDGGRHLGDVPHLRRQVRGEAVHVVGEVLPGAADALHVGLAAQLPLVAHLLRDARHLRREGVQLIDHRVHGRADAEELAADRTALDVEGHLLGEVALRDRRDDASDLVGGRDEIADELVHRAHAGGPGALRRTHRGALGHLSLLADDLRDAQELDGDVLVELEDVVQDLADAREDAVAPIGEADREVARLHRLEDVGELVHLVLARAREEVPLREAVEALASGGAVTGGPRNGAGDHGLARRGAAAAPAPRAIARHATSAARAPAGPGAIRRAGGCRVALGPVRRGCGATPARRDRLVLGHRCVPRARARRSIPRCRTTF